LLRTEEKPSRKNLPMQKHISYNRMLYICIVNERNLEKP
jgi:hypothetical protein